MVISSFLILLIIESLDLINMVFIFWSVVLVRESASNELRQPRNLLFDIYGNLLVVYSDNRRIQLLDLLENTCNRIQTPSVTTMSSALLSNHDLSTYDYVVKRRINQTLSQVEQIPGNHQKDTNTSKETVTCTQQDCHEFSFDFTFESLCVASTK